MTRTVTKTTAQPYLVEHTTDGYRVVTLDGTTYKPVNDKTYWHVTSAYAALGRLQHAANVAANNITTDPAKAPKKGNK